MDLFKKKTSTTARAWDWDVPQYTKRHKGDTQKLHKLFKKMYPAMELRIIK